MWQAKAAEQQSKHNEEQAGAFRCQLDELTAKQAKKSAAAASAAASVAERAARQEIDIKRLLARSAELQVCPTIAVCYVTSLHMC